MRFWKRLIQRMPVRTILFLLLIILLMISLSVACIERKPLTIGSTCPDIQWTTTHGQRINLSQFKGNWVMLCYICTCGAHRKDLDLVQSLIASLLIKNIDVIFIDEDIVGINYLANYSKPLSANYYLVVDKQNTIELLKSHDSRPVYFLIDESGSLKSVKLGGFSGSFDDLSAFLREVTDAKISNIQIDNITSTSASITWKTDKIAASWVELTGGRFKLGICILPDKPSMQHQSRLTGLSPSTKYWVNIVATSYDSPEEFTEFMAVRGEPKEFITTPDNTTGPIISEVHFVGDIVYDDEGRLYGPNTVYKTVFDGTSTKNYEYDFSISCGTHTCATIGWDVILLSCPSGGEKFFNYTKYEMSIDGGETKTFGIPVVIDERAPKGEYIFKISLFKR